MNVGKVIVSRTDAIGDVVLTMPLAALLKQRYPSSEVVFLGRSYTRAAVECCEHVDTFLAWDEVADAGKQAQADFLRGADVIIHVFPRSEIASAARRARIPQRVGSSHRAYHIWNCNKLVGFTRRKSELHESQLNVKLLKPFGITDIPSLAEIPALYGMNRIESLRPDLVSLISTDKLNVIIHPMTSGSSKGWSLRNYTHLIESLPADKYAIFVTGTEADLEKIGGRLPFDRANVTSLVGVLSLPQLIGFINAADALVCASTGPLHIAAALGKCAIGFYMPIGIAHPRRYGPVGVDAHALLYDPDCERCRDGLDCDCLQGIEVSAVQEILDPLADRIAAR